MEKKLSLNLFNLTFIGGLLFLLSGSPLYSQDSTEDAPRVEEKMQEGLQDEVHNTEDLESLLERYNSDQKKNRAGMETGSKEEETAELEMEGEDLPPAPKDPAMLKKILSEGKDKAIPKKEWPKTPSEALRASLVPLKNLDEAHLQEWLKTNFKGSKIDPYLERYPKIALFMTKMIKDPDGLPSLVKIVENKERLIRFVGVMLLTIVFGFLLKRFFYREKRSFLSAVGFFFLRLYIMTTLRVMIFYLFFQKELAPSYQIFKKTFL